MPRTCVWGPALGSSRSPATIPTGHHIDPGEDILSAVTEFHQASWGWALACCRHDADWATETLQESYCKLAEGRARPTGGGELKTWFFGVLRLTAFEVERRWRRRHTALTDEPVESATMERIDHTELRIALAVLPPRQQEILHLVFYQGLTVEQAAVAMGVGVGTARQHYHRAKLALRQRLQAGGTDDGR